tara:strand:+ start:207 stop:875 length:669 start_codon:yes stop_codon:yes gene_type:complete
MTLSPGMIKILGSIASSAMSSKGKSEKQVQPKANTQWHVDFQEPQTPLNNRDKVKVFNTRPLSTRLKGVEVNNPSLEIKGNTSGVENLKIDTPETRSYTSRERKLMDRLDRREARRTDRIDSREFRRKKRFDARDANEGKTYQEKRGTDVGNFFRRFKNPAADQNPPEDGGNTGATNYDDKKQEEQNTKLDTDFYKSDMFLNRVKPSQFGFKDIDHTKVNQD